MGDYLNEMDAEGYGIRVPATYYVQLLNKTRTTCNQRQVQKQRFSEIAQYFYNFDTTKTSSGQASSFASQLTAAGIEGNIDFIAMPQEANKILIRVENLDLSMKSIDLISLADAIHSQYNDNITNWDIRELSLSGNMDLSEM